MAIANFEIRNKEFEVRFISESGYPLTKKFNKKRRVYFDLEGNVYKDKQSNKVWFNLFKASYENS